MTEISGIARQLSNVGVAYAGEIASAAGRHDVDPKLLAAVAAQETGGPGANAGRNIVGDGGHGRGLFQIDDRFHAFARSSAAMDPAQNADYAAGMISGLLHSYGGDVHKALSAYNAGRPDATGTITQWTDGQRLGYADSVLRHSVQLGGTPAVLPVQTGAAAGGSGGDQQLIGEIQQEIAQVNQMQALAQGSPFDPTALSATPQFAPPPSYAQLSGLDSSGHSRYDVSYAGLIDDDDSNS